jgi:inorganic triphosphatase YgiF
MHEIELKLQVPPGQHRAVEAAVGGRTPMPRMRLQASYQDTADRTLAAAGLALRLRREGRQWVQTLKGAGDDGLTRLEHNVPRGAAAAMPSIDPALHAGTPAGDRLLALLAGASGEALQSLYRTDIRRRKRVLAVRTPGRPGARVELAFDVGKIFSGEAAVDVCELEIELIAGAALAVIDTARRWVPRHGLWVDGRSKAERGDLLARGQRVAPPRSASPLVLPTRVDGHAAWQAVLRNCGDQVLANASQVASGEHAPEHVHQLRVGLRRLRSAIALFDHDEPALADGAANLFRALGAARDQVVTEGQFGADLAEAMRSAGLPPEVGVGPAVAAPPMSHPILRAGASQAFLLDLLAAMHVQAPAGDLPPVRARLAARLALWHRQVVRGARRYAELDDERRHRLRKQAKRLRYAAEFCSSLFARKRVARYLKTLRKLQERLGEVSDVMMAMEVFKPRAPHEARAMFALGWLAARREVLIAQAAPELRGFAKAAPFWKG